MRFLDSVNTIPSKLLPLNDIVLATTVKGAQLYVMDSDRAEVIRKIDISPTSLLIGKKKIHFTIFEMLFVIP